jgi:hypothetical protein
VSKFLVIEQEKVKVNIEVKEDKWFYLENLKQKERE